MTEEPAAAEPKLLTRMLANPTEMPVTPEQVQWARCRPPEARTPIPKPGQLVHYRHVHFGPLTTAQVLEVDVSNHGDFGVWRYVKDERGYPVQVGGQYAMEMVEDPWVDTYLATDWGRIVTRESRIEGSAGWLPYL